MMLYGGDEVNAFKAYKSIGHCILDKLNSYGDKNLIIDGITSTELSAKGLLQNSTHLATCLQKNGHANINDTISIVSENRPEFPVVTYATLLLNCKVAPCNLTYSEREFEHAFNLSKPSIIFTSPFASEKVINVAKKLNYVKKVVLFGEENPFSSDSFVTLLDDYMKSTRMTSSFSPSPVDIHKQVAVILCSSGTTGLPKGVQITHANLYAATAFVQETVLNRLAIPEEERIILGIIPWFHAFGFLTMLGVTLTAGACIVSLPKFEEGLFLATIESYRTSILFMVPPLMVFLAKHPMVDSFDLSCIREIIVGAAPLTSSTENAVKKRLGTNLNVRQGYGMTELTLATMIQKDIFKAGSVGCLNPGQYAKIVDENGKVLGPNQPGELLMKGSQRMIGYIGNDKATKETIDNEGWLHTGDVAYYDNDRQFYIIDRVKELIKYKGFQVPPAELESLLLTHPSVRDAAVIGIPNEEVGELALGFIVKQENAEISEDEIKKFIAGQTSKAKHLHGGVCFIEAIPKNLSGKILRKDLREIAAKKNLKAKL